jgi:spermidine synthase
MKPYVELARAQHSDGTQLVLMHRSGDYFIEMDGAALMSTRLTGTERALAEMAIAGLSGVKKPRVLIGGLGLGFTLGAALDALPRNASVTVAEIFAPLVEWNRTYRFESGKDRLADPRVKVDLRDVVTVVREASGGFDAILLDVDNGPDSYCIRSNHRLYTPEGLSVIHRALRPGGVLGVWSAESSPAFLRKLRKAGFDAEMKPARSVGRKGTRHAVLLGRKPAPRR